MLFESPVHSADFKKYNNFFNLTSTYRIESDFDNLYFKSTKFFWALNESFDENADFHGQKDKFAAAVISNCGASSRRLDYIKQLQSHVSVDVFGSCGKPCVKNFKDGRPGDCKNIIGSEYKFYLAFENSHCVDYITEKFYDILNFNIIPVVLGGGNYSYLVIILLLILLREKVFHNEKFF
jgi:glycoprotein 3-alpha-L-fucosyltransferase